MNNNKVKLNGTVIQGPPLRYPKTPNLIIGEDNGYERGDILDANMVAELVKEGGGGSTSQMLGYVNPSTTSLPTTRIDGTPAEKEDYVKPESNSAFPFTIDGITFSTRLDRAIYLGDGRWMLDAGIIQLTNETPVTNEALESLTGSAVFQSDANEQFATTIGKSETIDVDNKETLISAVNHIWKELVSLEGKILKFKGFVSTTAPTGTIKDGSLWYESATLPTTFPINVKTYNATTSQWSTTTSQYTPEALDLWSNLNDDKGYYWFGNAWNIIDDSGKFVYVSTFTGVVGNPSVLYYLDTAYSTYEKGFYRFIPASGGTPEKFVLLNKELFKYVSTFTGETGDIDRLYFLDTQYDNYTIGFYRFFEAQGAEPAKFVRINPSPIQYVTTFTGVTGNTEYLYYLLTEYDNYEVGFYRFVKATGTEPDKFVHLNKVRFKYVSTFTGEIGDINRLYYLDTAYNDYKVGFYRYNGVNFVNINSKHFFIVSTFTGVDGDDESLYYLDTAYDNYKVGFYRFIPASDTTPARFVLIGRSLVKYVSTFTNVNGDTDALYYLDTDYISATNKYYPEGFYRYIERELGGVTVGEFVLINHNQVVYLPTFTDVTGNVEKLYYLYNDTASYFKGFYRFDPIYGDFVPLDETGIVYLSTFTGVVGKPNFLYFLDTEYDNYKKGFYRFVKEGSNPGRFVLFEPLDKEYVQYVSTFENLEDPDTEVLYYLDTAYTTATKTYKVGFYRYVEEVEEEVVVSSEFVLIGAASEVFTDVEELPTEDISDATIYRLKVFKYYHNGEEIEKPTGYKSLDTSVLIATPDYLEHHVSEEEIIQYVWEDVTDAILGQLSSLLEASTFEESDFLTLGENTYCHKTSVIEEITYELYHNPTKIVLGYLPLCIKGDVEVDELTAEFVDDKLQANAVITADSLPTIDIKDKSLYEITENVTISHETYTYDGNPIAVTPKSYKSANPNATVGENSLDIYMPQWDTTTSYYYKITPGQYWVNPELVEGWIGEGLIEEVEFTNNDSTAFCHYGDENFDNGSHFAKEGSSETHTITKLFRRRNNAWVSVSTIKVTEELYNSLTEAQKTDGTIYIIDEESGAILDVDILPTTNIVNNVLYRLNIKECRRKPTGDVIDNPVAYRSKNLEECSYNTDGMSFHQPGEEPIFYPWDNVDDTIISDLINGGYVEETSLEQGDFFKAASNFYLYKTSVEFVSYYELYHNPTATVDAFIKVGGSDVDIDNQTIVEVENKLRANAIIDIEILPTTNILKNTIYRKYSTTYMYNGSEISEPICYVSADTERVVITATGIDHMEEGTLLNHYNWEDVTDSVIFTVGNLAPATFEDAQMFKIGDNQYDYKTTVTKEQICELYHNPTGLQNDYKLIGNGGSTEVDEVTTELISDKVQANAIIPVTSLPTTNIKEKSLYQYTENVGYILDHWTRGDEEIATPLHFYKSTSYYLQVYNGEILYYNEEAGDPDWPYVNNHVEWYRFTDEHLNYFLNKNLIVECTPTDGTFCEYAASKYDWVNDGTSATMGVKHTSETKNFSMTKLFRRVNGAWESISVIGLTEEQYNNLPASIKSDGTLYIVDDAAELVVEMTYKALADKPVVNGITLNGSLTLEDLGLYSRTEVNALLESKGQVEFVDALPATPTKNTWYYSKKYEDGTDVPDNKRCLYIVDEDTTVFHEMGIVGDIEMETGDTLSGSEHLVTSSQVVKKEMSTKLNKYGTQVNIETAVDDATLWTTLAQIGTDDKKTDSSMAFNAGTCYLIHTVSPTKTAQIFQFIVTGSVGASAINKKITLINPTTNEIFTKAMDGGTWQAWKGGKKYKHTLVRYNNDSFEYTMGWVSIISDKKTMTYNDFRDWLNEKGYTTATNSYYWCGGCCGTTGVRNKEDTGTTYIGRVVSGVFYDGTNMFFKYDYNGTITILEARCKVFTDELN